MTFKQDNNTTYATNTTGHIHHHHNKQSNPLALKLNNKTETTLQKPDITGNTTSACNVAKMPSNNENAALENIHNDSKQSQNPTDNTQKETNNKTTGVVGVQQPCWNKLKERLEEIESELEDLKYFNEYGGTNEKCASDDQHKTKLEQLQHEKRQRRTHLRKLLYKRNFIKSQMEEIEHMNLAERLHSLAEGDEQTHVMALYNESCKKIQKRRGDYYTKEVKPCLLERYENDKREFKHMCACHVIDISSSSCSTDDDDDEEDANDAFDE